MKKKVYDKLNRWNLEDALWNHYRGKHRAAKFALDRVIERVVNNPPEFNNGKTKKREHEKARPSVQETGFHHPHDGHYEH